MMMNSRLPSNDVLNEEEAKNIIGKILVAHGFVAWRVENNMLVLRRKHSKLFNYVLGIDYHGYSVCIYLNIIEMKSPYKAFVNDWILDMHMHEQLCARHARTGYAIGLSLYETKSLDELRIKVDLM